MIVNSFNQDSLGRILFHHLRQILWRFWLSSLHLKHVIIIIDALNSFSFVNLVALSQMFVLRSEEDVKIVNWKEIFSIPESKTGELYGCFGE